jgi:hypothetical protein
VSRSRFTHFNSEWPGNESGQNRTHDEAAN